VGLACFGAPCCEFFRSAKTPASSSPVDLDDFEVEATAGMWPASATTS